jgi:hypothetical protein
MTFDSVTLTIDDIRFKWPTRRAMYVYAVVTAVDNLGRVHLFESAGRKRLVHRPLRDRPAVWDAGHDGLLAYQSVGVVPAVVAYAITLVRDRGLAREVGEILHRLRDSAEFRGVQQQLAAAAAASWPAAVALGLLAPITGLVGSILASRKDRTIDTVFGSQRLARGETRREFADIVRGELFDAEVVFSLFNSSGDGEADEFADPGDAGAFALLEPPPLALAAVGEPDLTEALPSPHAPIGAGRVTIGGRRVEVVYAHHDSLAVMEGDIILGSTDALARSAADVGASLAFGLGIEGSGLLWPGGRIPYSLHPELSDVVRSRIAAAIERWSQSTPLTFVARAAADRDYLEFVPSSGCASYVGRRGDRQELFLSSTCSVGNVIHELGHAIGLWHEQSREDRDGFVTVLWDNIRAGSEHNFRRHVHDGVDIGSYDYGSIMHYSPRAFSKNDLPTLLVPPGVEVGQRLAPSPGDLAAVRELYPDLDWTL